MAFSILSLTLAALFALLSAGTRSTQIATEYNAAVVWAESKLTELGVSEPLRIGTASGRYDAKYSWQLRVARGARQGTMPPIEEEGEWELVDVSLRVWWQSLGGERDLTVSTVRLLARE